MYTRTCTCSTYMSTSCMYVMFMYVCLVVYVCTCMYVCNVCHVYECTLWYVYLLYTCIHVCTRRVYTLCTVLLRILPVLHVCVAHECMWTVEGLWLPPAAKSSNDRADKRHVKILSKAVQHPAHGATRPTTWSIHTCMSSILGDYAVDGSPLDRCLKWS